MSDASTTRNDRAFLCREAIAEMMGPVIISAEIVQRYCELGDEAGIHYQLQCMAAYFRAAGAAYRVLAAVRNEALADESEGA
jgi:predicted xylose isomerase-like sugar epimerase